MPIRPENRDRYPKNWRSEVVPRIRLRSGNRCECTGQCGVNHGLIPEAAGVRCPRRHGEQINNFAGDKLATVILTVAHLNHTPEDCSDENLLHACQGCHNRYDAPMRAAGIKARKRAANAIGDFFCEPGPEGQGQDPDRRHGVAAGGEESGPDWSDAR